MILGDSIAAVLSYLAMVIILFLVNKNHENLLVSYLAFMGWLSFGHSYFPLRVSHYVYLAIAIILVVIKYKKENKDQVLKNFKKVSKYIILPYLLTTILLPLIYFTVTQQDSGNHYISWLKPLWVMALLPIILVDFNFEKLHKSLSNFFVFSTYISLPVTVYYYLKRGVSFHRVRGVDLYLEFIELGGFLLHGGENDPFKAWFQIDTLLSLIMIITGAIFVFRKIAAIIDEKKKSKVISEAVFLFFTLIIAVSWNYFMLTAFLLLVLFGASIILLLEKSMWKKNIYQRNTLIICIFSIIAFEAAFDRYQEISLRYETVKDRLNLKQEDIVIRDGFYVYEGLTLEEIKSLNRLSRWKIMWINFVYKKMYFKGVGYIENEEEKENLYLRSGLFSGHSKVFDDMTRFGVFNGLFLNSIFWLPPVLLLMLFFKFREVGLLRFWAKSLLLLGANAATSIFAIWGEFPAGIALQLYVLFPLVVVCHAIKKDPNSLIEGEFVELKDYGVL